MEEGQQYVRMESFEYLFKWLWSYLKNLLVQVCAKLPWYLDKAVNQLIENHAMIQRSIIVK